jgi:thiol:disulfide interchange protein DsbD
MDIAAQLSAHPATALPALFGAGVLTSLTPCIYPMIPITAAIIGGQTVATADGAAPRGARARAAALTLAFGIGLASVVWARGGVAPVRLPTALVQRAAVAGTAGRFAGALGMGAMSGLVAAPCSAPVMAAVLTWVSATRSAALGFLYLFTFSLGMCALLVAVGLSSAALARGAPRWLPRAGGWMVWVKRGFALLMLGAAEYYFVQMGTVWF